MADSNSLTAETTRRIVTRWVLRSALGVIIYGLILFGSAGRLDWGWGWVFLAVLAGLAFAPPLFLSPRHPDLLAEREKGLWQQDAKDWDRAISTVAGALMLAEWIVAGLDLRFHSSAPLPGEVHAGGLLLTCAGYALFLWAMASNAYFANVVRIQTDRGHQVQTGGPYRWVRHPGYAGTILAMLATPILLGSWWALVPAVLSAGLFLLRTALEDRTLRAELPGYEEFTQQTRYRLFPGIW